MGSCWESFFNAVCGKLSVDGNGEVGESRVVRAAGRGPHGHVKSSRVSSLVLTPQWAVLGQRHWEGSGMEGAWPLFISNFVFFKLL